MSSIWKYSLSGLILIVMFGATAGTDVPLPDSADFAHHVLQTIATYPTDGTHAYYWPKHGSWQGVTRDIAYEGRVVAQGDPQGRCHCSGLTWEVFMRALDAYNREHTPKVLNAWTNEEVQRFRFLWFGSDGNKQCIHNAVLTFAIGFAIKDKNDAAPGDFVQFWRGTGSGHSVVFDRWVRDPEGNITALRYWSTQKKTNGIAYNTETVGGKKGIDLNKTYIVRIGAHSQTPRAPTAHAKQTVAHESSGSSR